MDKQIILIKLKSSIKEIKRRFSVKSLSVFGSIVRDQALENSDIDVLVEFNRKASFDLFMDLKFYLEDLLGASVDLVTNKALRPQVRRAIEGEMIDVT